MSDKPERRSAGDKRIVYAPAPVKPRLASRDLLAGYDEVIIEHGGEEYHLRHTRAGKLILTK